MGFTKKGDPIKSGNSDHGYYFQQKNLSSIENKTATKKTKGNIILQVDVPIFIKAHFFLKPEVFSLAATV